MNNRYQEILNGAHVGDNLYFRVIHKTMDTTSARDSVTINLETKTGKKQSLKLSETFAHSGVFKGTIKLAYSGDKEGAQEAGVLPVDYGDNVTAHYQVDGMKEPLTCALEIYKGSDGKVLPFTRRFKDLNLAVQTQFTIAESYFELAKQHRAQNMVDQARQEMADGKKLLEEAIRDYPRDESKVEAEYLLAELSLEVAEDTNDEELKHKHYTEAQIRFSEIVTSYPDSDRAPWSQYKKALIYEKLNMMDQACEEYVKLSCRYPKHDLVCDTIAQLGDYFRKKAIEIETQSTVQQDPIQAEKLHQQAKATYVTAAEVFSRLGIRNPSHRLAQATTIMSADCYRSSEHWDKALAQYRSVIDSPVQNPELVPPAMYWSGICMMSKNDDLGAFHMFKNLIWKYPSSTEAKKAKGKMYEDRLLEAEKKESKD
jgi:TolA-binding protein